MDCIVEEVKVEYYERIHCTHYYHDGLMVWEDKPFEILCIGFTELGMGAVCDKPFEIGDVLLFDIVIDHIPYDKLMGEVLCIHKKGDLYRMDLLFLGMSNILYEKLKEIRGL